MRRIAVFLGSLCIVLLSIGCAHTPNTTQPPAAIAPGYLNQTDEDMGITLSGVRAFYSHLQQDIAKGTYTPSDAEKTALKSLYTAINTAEALYIAYHASPSIVTEDAANRAVQAAKQQQTALEPTIPGVS